MEDAFTYPTLMEINLECGQIMRQMEHWLAEGLQLAGSVCFRPTNFCQISSALAVKRTRQRFVGSRLMFVQSNLDKPSFALT